MQKNRWTLFECSVYFGRNRYNLFRLSILCLISAVLNPQIHILWHTLCDSARICYCQCRFCTSKCCFSLEFNQNWCSTNSEISRFECFVAFYTKDKEFKQIFMSIEYHLSNANMFRFCNISGPLRLFWTCILHTHIHNPFTVNRLEFRINM